VRGDVRGVAIVLLAAVEEIAWRGGVQQLLAERLGSVRAWIAASVLFALAHLGTGNGAVALLALVGGLLWGGLYLVRGRLTPAIIAHSTFSFAFFYHRPIFALRYDGFGP
jgi:hypothetical protein